MAELEDLKNAWQSQSGISQERFNEIGSKVSGSTQLLQSKVFRRDMIETCASAFVAVAFTFLLFFFAKNWIDWSGYLVIVLAGTAVPIVMWRARTRSISTVSAANFRDFVDIEIDYLRRQVQLLRSVGWWYLLPFYIGVALVMVGVVGPEYSIAKVIVLAVCLVVCAAVYIWLWCLNQRARTKHLEPLLEYYVWMKSALDSDGDSMLDMADPPTQFLDPKVPRTISRRQRWIGMLLALLAMGLVAIAGEWTMRNFDQRTGIFVLTTMPVVGILLIVMSGCWRRVTTDGKDDQTTR